MENTQNTNEIDALWGCEAIAEFIGRTKRQTFHLLEKRYIPAQKVGNVWVASPRKLRARLFGEAA